ncbi:SWF or SNF family helicase [Streptomyces sp. TRM66268-LWL]|uniref:SWF or SNF family helicase n=1 Tax=Streptomyces polyasparticus TaxID=2767826 RepID=A0ABR7ST04_9ACTN|nr:SWF or SNF family helicase [Streptomyces polyasparticus]MBC9717463.1 SWF or SNF family helicase [Streptomyces polyasparticus]
MTVGEERTFEPLPPAHGRGFAMTWWGQAWLKALEDTALDNQQTKVGRRLARAGAVGAVSVRPGRITAVVQDKGRQPCRSDVLLQQLSDEAWDRFLDMAVESSGHIAALLDREMPPHLVEDAAAVGIELLPGIGDLEPECSCEAWDHCGHTAALSYQMARLLDQDPFVLLLMRGRSERALLDELQVRSVARASAAPQEPAEPVLAQGVRADEAYAMGAILPPLPALPALPEAPGQPPALDTETAPAPGLDVRAVEFLARSATTTAHQLLTAALSDRPLAALPAQDQDAVRLAVGAPAEVRARLAEGTGRSRDALELAVQAWEFGGAAALDVLENAWTPDTDDAVRARAALDAAWEEDERPRLNASRNRWTLADAPAQLRFGRDGRWWPYRKERGRWTPAGPAAQDPAAALAGLVAGEQGD